MNWEQPKQILCLLKKTLLERAYDLILTLSNSLLVASMGLIPVAVVGVSRTILLTYGLLIHSFNNVTTSKVGKTLGEEEASGDSHSQKGVVIIQGFYFVSILSLLVGILSICLAPQLLSMSGANSETIQHGTNYFRIMGGCFLLEALREQAVASLQGMEDYQSPKRSGFWRNVGHLLLAAPIIYLFHLSLAYVAWATVMSEVIGLTLLLHPLKKQAFPNEIPWKWNKTILLAMFHLSKFVLIQSIFTRVSLMLYFGMFFSYGTEAYAAMRFHAQVASLTYAVADAFIAILNPLCSKLYGERTFLHSELKTHKKTKQDQTMIQELQNKRKKKDQELLGMVNWGTGLACLFVGLLSLVIYLAGEWIAGLYTSDTTTIQLVQMIFLASILSEVFFTWYYLLNRSALAAVEDRKGSMFSVMIATGVWVIVIIVIQEADLGLIALLTSRLLFEVLRGSLVAKRFYSKHWSRPVV